jgi:glucose-1-phosphate cytidylyltransferase
MIKEFFLNYDEALSNNFTISEGGSRVEMHHKDIEDWRITLIDTGMHSNIGERLLAARAYIGEEEVFLANYSDGLSDLPLDRMIDDFHAKQAVAAFLAVPIPTSFHSVELKADHRVARIGAVADSNNWINGGFFVFRRDIFDYLRPGEEIVEEPFQRLIREGKLVGFPYKGFWRAMDTFKDKIGFDRDYASGKAPWEIWRARKP